MDRRRLWLKVYVGVTITAGAAALAATSHQWSQMQLGAAELALFIGLAGILDAMVVPVAGGGAMAASFAVFFGGVLAVGAQPTAWVAALAVMWSEALVRRRPLPRACFNASHSVLSLLAAGWVYQALGAQVGWVELKAGWPAVVAAAVVLWALETGWASVAVALERGGRLSRRLRSWLGPGLAWDGGLASVGLLLALLYQNRWQLVGHSGWQGAFLLAATVLIPSALLYYAYRLQGNLQKVYSQSLRTLGSLLEAKVEGSQPGHGERVAHLAARLAESLELPHRDVEQIRYAAYLHDIGKVGVPSSLLTTSPDRLCAEPEAVRLHAQIGAAILSPIRFLQPAAQFVTSHHERWDGLGYPQGLRQKQIPLGARVLALANAYVSLTHSPHAPLAPPQAISHLHQAAGSRFDPELVAQLERLLRRSGDLTASGAGIFEMAAR